MIARRAFASSLLTLPIAMMTNRAWAQKRHREIVYALEYPPVRDRSGHNDRASSAPTSSQIERANAIVKTMPRGPRPIDIAQSFVDRFYYSEPEIISQLPPPAALNPLISRFFETTSTREGGDVVAWCAAFANFCIYRSGMAGSRSASSQSFLQDTFPKTQAPVEGDLAVFTCFDRAGHNLRIGHVAFFRQRIDDSHIRLVGGNQSTDGHSSIICETVTTTADRLVRRHLLNGEYCPVAMRLNTYVSLNV